MSSCACVDVVQAVGCVVVAMLLPLPRWTPPPLRHQPPPEARKDVVTSSRECWTPAPLGPTALSAAAIAPVARDTPLPVAPVDADWIGPMALAKVAEEEELGMAARE